MASAFLGHSTPVKMKIIKADKKLRKHAVTFQVWGGKAVYTFTKCEGTVKKKIPITEIGVWLMGSEWAGL